MAQPLGVDAFHPLSGNQSNGNGLKGSDPCEPERIAMSISRALPFTLRRSEQEMTGSAYTSTKEQVDGLLRLGEETLSIQSRKARTIEEVGTVRMRTDREVDAVEEFTLPLSAIASVSLRRSWFRWPPGTYLHLTASDLQGFEPVAGPHGLHLSHPAELVVRVATRDVGAAREFVSELELALAERALRTAEGRGALPKGDGDPTAVD